MPRVRFEFDVSGGPAALSTGNPDVEFRVLASLSTDERFLVVFEIPFSEPLALDGALTDEFPTPEYTVLHTDEHRLVVQVSLREVPDPYRPLFESGVPVQFPISVRDGRATVDLVTSQDGLSRLRAAFEAADTSYEIAAVSQSTERPGLLTDRQREVVLEALNHGYYESPRRCTLTDLADALNVTKGAVSGTLHRAESRLVESFFGR